MLTVETRHAIHPDHAKGMDTAGLREQTDDPIERQLSAQLLSKGLKLLAEPLIAAQLLQLDALPAVVELCFRPPAAPNG